MKKSDDISILDFVKEFKKDIKEDINKLSEKFSNFSEVYKKDSSDLKKEYDAQRTKMWQSIRNNEKNIVRIQVILFLVGAIISPTLIDIFRNFFIK